jgi:AraC-like DNA-binding protein
MSNYTVNTLSKETGLDISALLRGLGMPQESDLDATLPVKKVLDFLKVHGAIANPQTSTQKQLQGNAPKEIVKQAAKELKVSQALVTRISAMNLESSYQAAYNAARLENAHILVGKIGAAEGQKDADQELKDYEEEVAIAKLLKTFQAAQVAQEENLRHVDDCNALVESYKPGSPLDAARAALAQEQARNELIEAVQNGTIPTEAQLQDFTVARAYRQSRRPR